MCVMITTKPVKECGYCGNPFFDSEGKLFDGTYQYKTLKIDDVEKPVHEDCWDEFGEDLTDEECAPY
jgi:hypothetical protein